MSSRPDIVECWIFRIPEGGGAPEYLLIRRAPGRIYAGLWQCVTGRIEPGERVTHAALREVAEEVGFGPPDIEAFYDLDQVSSFYDARQDAVVSSVIFAIRVRASAEPTLSEEHDGAEWAGSADAVRRSIWPSYRETVARIEAILADPVRAHYANLDLEGRRLAR